MSRVTMRPVKVSSRGASPRARMASPCSLRSWMVSILAASLASDFTKAMSSARGSASRRRSKAVDRVVRSAVTSASAWPRRTSPAGTDGRYAALTISFHKVRCAAARESASCMSATWAPGRTNSFASFLRRRRVTAGVRSSRFLGPNASTKSPIERSNSSGVNLSSVSAIPCRSSTRTRTSAIVDPAPRGVGASTSLASVSSVERAPVSSLDAA